MAFDYLFREVLLTNQHKEEEEEEFFDNKLPNISEKFIRNERRKQAQASTTKHQALQAL